MKPINCESRSIIKTKTIWPLNLPKESSHGCRLQFQVSGSANSSFETAGLASLPQPVARANADPMSIRACVMQSESPTKSAAGSGAKPLALPYLCAKGPDLHTVALLLRRWRVAVLRR